MRVALVSAFVLLLAGACGAQESAAYTKCTEGAKAQPELNACAAAEAERTDAELNRVYRQLLAAVADDKAATAKIKLAEQAWIAYRDAYLEAMYPAEDKQAEYGSIYLMDVNLLAAKLTRQQIMAVEALLKNNE